MKPRAPRSRPDSAPRKGMVPTVGPKSRLGWALRRASAREHARGIRQPRGFGSVPWIAYTLMLLVLIVILGGFIALLAWLVS